jgi:hypothetical protein
MAILRMAASAGAALIALAAIVPAASQAQAPRAPLQLVPGPDQARPVARVGGNRNAAKSASRPVAKISNNKTSNNKTSNNKAANKALRTATTRTNARQAAAVARPASKAARASVRPTANAMANRQPLATSNAQRARVAFNNPAVRFIAMPEPILNQPHAAPRIFAQSNDADDDHVMRDGDSVSLVGRLPWWRNDRMQPVTYGSAEAESKVLEAAAVWLAANGMANAAQPVSETGAPDASEDVEIADPGEINDIDLAAEHESPPPQPTFLQSLLALISGAASAIAATVRQLFA